MRYVYLLMSFLSLANISFKMPNSFAQDSVIQNNSIKVIAHRALACGVPENTLAAIRKSIALGVDMVEVDIRITKDGHIIIMHDKKVNRTTSGKGLVKNLTLKEVKSLDAGSWFSPEFSSEKVPGFVEVLEVVSTSESELLIDIKDSQFLNKKEMVLLIKSYGLEKNVVIGIRSLEELLDFRSLDKGLRLLGFIASPSWIDMFISEGIDIIRLWPLWIQSNSYLIEKVHSHGCSVWITAGDASSNELLEIIETGVDGILTDRPEELLRILNRNNIYSKQ